MIDERAIANLVDGHLAAGDLAAIRASGGSHKNYADFVVPAHYYRYKTDKRLMEMGFDIAPDVSGGKWRNTRAQAIMERMAQVSKRNRSQLDADEVRTKAR